MARHVLTAVLSVVVLFVAVVATWPSSSHDGFGAKAAYLFLDDRARADAAFSPRGLR